MTGDSQMSTMSNKERLSKFLERQTLPGPKEEIRLQISNVQREVSERFRPISAGKNFTSVQAFKNLLLHRFGTITIAWRLLLDPDMKGKVSMADFCTSCRDIGFCRGMKQLWIALDTEQLGYIQLDQLDAEAANALREFRHLNRLKHGSLLKAYQWFDPTKKNRIDFPFFQMRCKELKVTSEVRKLFRWLQRDISRKFLTIHDFDEQAMQCLYREDTGMVSVKTRKSAVATNSTLRNVASAPNLGDDDRPSTAPAEMTRGSSSFSTMTLPPADDECRPGTAPAGKHQPGMRRTSTMGSRWTLARSKEQIRVREEATAEERRRDKGMKSFEDLKHLLIVKYGSIFTGWRNALDLDGNGKLSFGEFCQAMRNLGYGGDVKNIWRMLDNNGDGFVSLKEFDEETYELMTSYKDLVTKKFGTMLKSWQSMNSHVGHGSGHIDEAMFTRHCQEVGWDGNAAVLFKDLKEEKGRKFLTLKDYDTQAHNAFQRGDMEMLTEQKPDHHKMAMMNFHERQENAFSQRWARMSAKRDIKDLEKRAKLIEKLDIGAHTVDTLKAMLIRKYGTITAAWKHGLDIYGNGRVPFGEFCAAMRRLGFAGNIRAIFNELDHREAGAITLQDLDSAAHDLLVDFRKVLLDKFGTYIKAWQALDTNRNSSLEEHELVEECAKLGFRDERQAKMLFKYLLDGPGKTTVHMADLDPAAMQAYYRGDLEAMSKEDKAKKLLKEREEAKQAELNQRMGANDFKALKRELIKMYGSITAAFRNGLNTSGNGKLSFVEFSKACRNMGVQADVRKIFAELDDDHSGIITFNELDEKWYARLTDFHDRLLNKYHTYESAWRALDDNRNNMLEQDEFEQVCKDIGYCLSKPSALFHELRRDNYQRYLTLADIDVQDIIIGVQTAGGENKQPMLRSQTSVFARTDADLLSPVERAKKQLSESQKMRQAVKDEQLAANDATSLKKLLVRKYGSITAAWRQALDLAGHGKCSFVDFSKACRDAGFNGNIKACFKEMDTQNKGIITFDELAPDWYEKLHEFADLCREKFGEFDDCMAEFDKNHNNTIEVEELADVCKSIGYKHDPKALFNQLRKGTAVHHITEHDLKAAGVINWEVTRFSGKEPHAPLVRTNTAHDPKAQLARSQEMSSAHLHHDTAHKRYFE